MIDCKNNLFKLLLYFLFVYFNCKCDKGAKQIVFMFYVI